ncbi:hypothetical protein E6C76_13980 [Pseudothauera nasutitermitis]|uniref:Uncharacterized protein n=1 Tax=Pseudothauera nasutitermitis TaxID=2565930 RepID=A0A4V3WBL7_9RHOO|nr:hypothetical protein [Pseudothauera nasutitermitis]THF63693.1 hypothetical protein E6C76_13980 [Pseudothauera nasutitermitis]
MNPIRYRHAYLHATLAGESEHVVAAATELRAHKNKQGVQAGHLFVDSAQALNTANAILFNEMGKLRAGKTWNQFTQDARAFQKYQDLRHAAAHLVDLSDQNANVHLRGPQDKLYVKGHGSATNDQGISTIARTKTQHEQEFVKESLAVRHQIRDVASGVMRVGDKLGQEHLDVRLTSCGSGGGYEFDTINNAIKPTGGHGAAGRLSRELLHRDANMAYTVHGYRGSTNSTNPVRFPENERHFQTTVKFHNLDHQNSHLIPLQPFTQTFGLTPALGIASRKVTLEQYTSKVTLNPGMDDKIRHLNTLRGPNPDNSIKRTHYVNQQEGIEVTMRRSKARVRV